MVNGVPLVSVETGDSIYCAVNRPTALALKNVVVDTVLPPCTLSSKAKFLVLSASASPLNRMVIVTVGPVPCVVIVPGDTVSVVTL